MADACERAVAHLGSHGPTDEDALLEAIGFWDDPAEAGDVDGFMDHLFEDHGVWQLGGDVCFLPSHVLDGRTFTHRVSEREVADRELGTMPDLVASIFAGDGDGEAPTFGGVLDTTAPGDLVAVSWSDGAERVTAPGRISVGDEPVLLRRTFDDQVGDDGVVDLVVLLGRSLLASANAFAEPTAPLSDLLAEAGLEVSGDWVAEAGFDWDARAARHREAAIDATARRHGLDRARAALLVDLQRAPSTDTLPVDALRDPVVTDLFVETELVELVTPWHLGRVSSIVDAALRDPDPPAGARLVAARLAEHRGDLTAFAAHLDALLATPDASSTALDDGVYLASLRGDAYRAVDLLTMLGVPRTDEQLRFFRRYTEAPPGVSKNAPCPCGSGRKTKLCCLGQLPHPLLARAAWVLDKLEAFTERPPQAAPLHEAVADLLDVEDPDGADDVELAAAHPATWALWLFDDDGLDGFLAAAGPLLPPDERVLVESWRGTRHRLLQLDDVLPGVGVRLTDVGTGEQLEAIADLSGSSWRVGGLAVGLVLPIEGRWLVAGEPTMVVAELEGPARAAAAAMAVDPSALARLCLDWFAIVGRQLMTVLERQRLALAAPGVDPDDAMDLTDDDLTEIVEQLHPAMVAAIERGEETMLVDGNEVNPRLHLALHVAAARCLLDDEPAGAAFEAIELLESGHPPHEVLHHVMHGISGRVWDALQADSTTSRISSP